MYKNQAIDRTDDTAPIHSLTIHHEARMRMRPRWRASDSNTTVTESHAWTDLGLEERSITRFDRGTHLIKGYISKKLKC